MSRRGAATLVCAALMAAHPARAEVHGDWAMLPADGAAACLLVQTVALQGTGRTVAQVMLDGHADGSLRIAVRVPLGAGLAQPLVYMHPGRDLAVPLDWTVCGAETCLAQTDVVAAEVDRLRRGDRIVMAFLPLRDSRPVSVSVSLRGVTRGLRAQATCKDRASR
jgi:invasion protein IalB